MNKVSFLLIVACLAIVSAEIAELYGTLENLTGSALYLKECNVQHGEFITTAPGVIASMSNGTWYMEAGGMGCEADCTYYIGSYGNSDQIYMYMDVPEVGSNKFSVETTEADGYSAYYTGGEGYHCYITFVLTKPV